MISWDRIGLDEVFILQDEAAKRNFNESSLVKQAYGVVTKTISLCYIVLKEMPFEALKKTAIRWLAVDCLSHAIVAMRIGLWGALPESLGVLRGATESGAQLSYVVRERKYKTLAAEMARKFQRVSYETAFEGLGSLGGGMEGLHGRISDVASHSTAKRLALVDYEFEGQDYDRLGFAPAPQNAEIAAFYSMLVCMPVCDALYAAHQQDGLEFPLSQDLLTLLREFDAVCEKFYERVPKLKETVAKRKSEFDPGETENNHDAG